MPIDQKPNRPPGSEKPQGDSRAADQLIRQYLPFIKSETARFLKRPPDENQDELNIAMFAFYESILSYRTEKGAFFTLASTAIRNRLIDYARKEQRHKSLLSLDLPSSQDDRSLENSFRIVLTKWTRGTEDNSGPHRNRRIFSSTGVLWAYTV